MFKTDSGGVAIKLSDCKLSTSSSASSWGTRLSQIASAKGNVIICTYSLPNKEYIGKILRKKQDGITIIANSKFLKKAIELKNEYPSINIILANDIHAKIVLIEPNTVWLSSANFGSSGWFEHCIGIHDRTAYLFYVGELERHIGRRLFNDQRREV